jgi:uncharacterized protein (TIGR02145 family)
MKKIYLILILLLPGIIIVNTCKKVEKQMLVSTGTVTNILPTSADVSGKILDLGDGATEYGHCYSTSPNSNITVTKTEYSSPAIGGFTSALTGLTPSTKYYIKAYIKRGSVVVYGEEINFTTASDALPSLTTVEITGVSKNSAASGGNISDQGGTPVSARGVCWGIATLPVISSFKTVDGSGIGSFTSSITMLSAGTKYYVRAYATNAGGTGYGNELSFTTTPDAPVLPTATTSSANPVNITTANLNGVVNANGQSTTVTFEYGLTNSYGNSVTASQSPVTGTTNIDVSASLTGLTGGTTYHFRVKAESGGGVSYGLDQTFKTLCSAPAAVTNLALNISNSTVTLKGTVTANGFSTTVTFEYGMTTGYGSSANDIEGVITGTNASSVSANLNGLLPNTTYHFRVAATSCGGTIYGTDQTFTTNCNSPTVATGAATNPGTTIATINGTVNANGFSSSLTFEYGTNTSYGNSVAASPATVTGSDNNQVSVNLTGLAVNTLYHYRVSANNCGGTVTGNDMTFTTLPALSFNYYIASLTSAACQAIIDAGGGASISARGFCWSTSQNPTINDSKTPGGTGTGTYTASISGLTMNTAYYFRAYATNNGGTSYSDQYLLKTSAGTITDVEGNLYSTVTIGSQVWMRENLRTTKYYDGTQISLVSDNTTWSGLSTAAYCWYNNNSSAYGSTYGALYNWYAIGSNKLCPSGWHASTLGEWQTVINNYGGLSSAGGKLKDISTTYWTSPNSGATNETGITILPAGYRNQSGAFSYLGDRAYFWTNSQYSSSYGWNIYLYYNSSSVAQDGFDKKYGYSVRCVKD